MSAEAISLDDLKKSPTQEIVDAVHDLPAELATHVHEVVRSLIGETAADYIFARKKKKNGGGGQNGSSNAGQEGDAHLSNRARKRLNKQRRGSGKPTVHMDKRK